MKKFIYLAILLMNSLAYAQVNVSWSNYPGGVAVATDTYNNVYTANWDYNPAGDITLTKRNDAGSILWNASYNNTDNTRHEVATWVETDNAGNILISGIIRSGYSNPVNAASILMKYSPTGTLLWRVVYESSFDGSSTKKCLVDANNNIYVLGIGAGPNGLVTKVKKFNSSGTAVWNYFDTGIGGPVNFKFTPENNIVISHRGITGSINGFSKIDLNGNKIWSIASINSLTVGDATGDAQGNTYLVNGNYGSTTTGSIVKKISPSGTLIWEKVYTAMNGLFVEVGSDNNPVIGGTPIAGYGVAFRKYDNNGNLLWQNLDADGPGLALLSLAQMKLDGSNAAYIAGSTMSQMGVCKVNSDGTAGWTITTASGYPTCIDFGTNNSVYVTGGTTARISQTGTPPVPAPAAPSNLSATVANTSTINLSWTDNANNETNYILQRSLTSDNGFSTMATLAANITSYSNNGLNASTTYYYRVQAINAGSGSAWSNLAFATTASIPPVTLPAAPSNLKVSALSCNQLNLTWSDNSNNETGFEIRRSTSLNGTYTLVKTVAANTTAYTNTGLTNNRRYYYRVRSVNNAGSSAWSNTANAVVICTPLSKVSGVNQSLSLYPNPVENGQLNINLPVNIELPVTVEIISSLGQRIYTKQLIQYNNTIQTKGYIKGWYILRLHDNERIQTIKFLIK